MATFPQITLNFLKSPLTPGHTIEFQASGVTVVFTAGEPVGSFPPYTYRTDPFVVQQTKFFRDEVNDKLGGAYTATIGFDGTVTITSKFADAALNFGLVNFSSP